MNSVLVLGYRADGRPVWLARGGAEGGDGDAGAAGADTAADKDAGAADDGAEEVEFSEAAFKKLVEDLNAERKASAEHEAQIKAIRAEMGKKVEEKSREAAKYRVRAKALAEAMGQEEAADKGAAKADAKADTGPDPEVQRLAAELKAMQERTLRSEAESALLKAEAKPKHTARLVRMLDLGGGDDTPSIADQIAEIKADMPELFGPAQTAAAGAGAARTVRVAGKGGAAGGTVVKEKTTSEVLAERLRGASN